MLIGLVSIDNSELVKQERSILLVVQVFLLVQPVNRARTLEI